MKSIKETENELIKAIAEKDRIEVEVVESEEIYEKYLVSLENIKQLSQLDDDTLNQHFKEIVDNAKEELDNNRARLALTENDVEVKQHIVDNPTPFIKRLASAVFEKIHPKTEAKIMRNAVKAELEEVKDVYEESLKDVEYAEYLEFGGMIEYAIELSAEAKDKFESVQLNLETAEDCIKAKQYEVDNLISDIQRMASIAFAKIRPATVEQKIAKQERKIEAIEAKLTHA